MYKNNRAALRKRESRIAARNDERKDLQAITDRFDSLWNGLAKPLAVWLGSPGHDSEFESYVGELIRAAKAELGDDCIIQLKAFRSKPFALGANPSHREAEALTGAMAVEFFLSLIASVDGGAKIKPAMAKARKSLGDLLETEIQEVASFANLARNVLLRCESNAKCRKCENPLTVWQYGLENCPGCQEKIRSKKRPKRDKRARFKFFYAPLADVQDIRELAKAINKSIADPGDSRSQNAVARDTYPALSHSDALKILARVRKYERTSSRNG